MENECTSKSHKFHLENSVQLSPMLMASQRRQVIVPVWCPICLDEPEDELHALVFCPAVCNVWCLTAIWSFIGTTSSFQDWWIHFVSTRFTEEIDFVSVVLWCIWLNRNDVVWNAKYKSAASIFHSAADISLQ